MNAIICCLCLITILFIKAFSATVVQGPVSRTADAGEWAEFTCSVACSHSIDWYVEGYTGDISDTCSTTLDGMMVCTQVTQACSSTSSPDNYMETLRVLAKPELASSSITVQCAAISLSEPSLNNCPPFLSYSRYALLNVRSLATEAPSAPMPVPTPVVCPTAVVQDIDTMSTVTVTQEHTVTQTLTQTVVVTVTPEPNPVISRGTSPGNHLGRVLAGLMSWVVTVLAGVMLM